MRTKILMSILMIGVVAIGAGAGTLAYFSDVEKSTGNTFTAGAFDLKIDSDCHFNGMDCVEGFWKKEGETATTIACDCKWDAKDLTDERFFDFVNLKPGDSGEVTISMHVSGDDYYVRSKVDNVKNKDNGCNDPEKEAGDTTCGNPGSDTSGELGANMDFAFWADMGTTWGYQGSATDTEEGDNILNSVYENATYNITSGDDLTGVWRYVIDPSTDSDWVFLDGSTYYMGVAWCVGDLSIATSPDGNGVYAITCDGSSASSIIQTDSCSSDMTFEVQQASNNPNPWG